MDKYIRISLIIAILIPSTSLGYYYGIILPKNEQTKIEAQKQMPEPIAAPEKKSEVSSPTPAKVINRPYIAPKTTKDTNLEIEKCKSKLHESPSTADMDEIINVLNQVFAPQREEHKKRGLDAVNMFSQCLTDHEGGDTSGCNFAAEIMTNQLKEMKDSLAKQSSDGLQQMIKNQQQQNYQNCLNSI